MNSSFRFFQSTLTTVKHAADDAPEPQTEAFLKSKVKSFLANERTFIKWMQFSVAISSIGIAILNFGNSKDSVPYLALFIELGALFIILFSYLTFMSRASRISKGESGSFYSQFLPICVIIFFIVSSVMILSAAIKR